MVLSSERRASVRPSKRKKLAACIPVLVIQEPRTDRERIAAHLEGYEQYALTVVSGLSEALDLLSRLPIEVVIADLDLTDNRGLECVRRLQQGSPERALLVLSCLDNEDFAKKAIRLGASDYLVMGQIGPAQLHRAVAYAMERKRALKRLLKLAHYDQLTGLPNRTTLYDRLGHAIARARRRVESAAVMFIDLDGFKAINDSLGHDMGDALLQEVGRRLFCCIRHADTVARWGGDEFAVLLEDLSDGERAHEVAQRILEVFNSPFMLGEIETLITTSIGIAIYPDSAKTPEQLIKLADRAMYDAKANGRNRFSDASKLAQRSAAPAESLTLSGTRRLNPAFAELELCNTTTGVATQAAGDISPSPG